MPPHSPRLAQNYISHKTAVQYFLLKPAAVPVHCLLAILLVFNFIYNSFMLNVTIETKGYPRGTMEPTERSVSHRIFHRWNISFFLLFTLACFFLHKFSPRKKKMWDDSLFHALKLWTCSDFKCLFVCLPWMRERGRAQVGTKWRIILCLCLTTTYSFNEWVPSLRFWRANSYNVSWWIELTIL